MKVKPFTVQRNLNMVHALTLYAEQVTHFVTHLTNPRLYNRNNGAESGFHPAPCSRIALFIYLITAVSEMDPKTTCLIF
jgi:hypothetical protein